LKESEVIKSLFAGHLLPDDDCHFLPPDILVTTDSLVEGTHFLHNWSNAKQLAEKLIEVNVSDITASGGIPTICFLNLGLSEVSKKDIWVKEFSQAFRNRLKFHKMQLVGGDTFYSKNTHLTLTAFGKTNQPWTRSGALDGDYLYITGSIGDSELGLQCLKGKKRNSKFSASIKKHLTPRSRALLLPFLSNYPIHACMDLTDGLIQDSERLAIASNGQIEIMMESLPISKLAYQHLGWDEVLGSGEELELLFFSDAKLPSKLGNVKITRIGTFKKIGTKKKPLRPVTFLLNGNNYIPQKIGYTHF